MKATDGVVLRMNLCGLRVCVPREWSNDEITDFANTERPTGIKSCWVVAENGASVLGGDQARIRCADDREKVHVVLYC